jgi:hypothetical protein
MGVFDGRHRSVGVRVGDAAPSGTFTDFGPARASAFSTAGISGDFNNNGAVDAADYVLWRNAGLLQNDPTPGVQSDDYDAWRANFGQVGDVASAYTVAFHGTYDDPPKSGIFTKRGGQLTTIAKVGDLMPSTASPIVHVYSDLAISGNTVVFGATDAGGTSAILMSSGGELSTVAKIGDMTSLGPLESIFPSPAISGNSVAFAATAGDGSRGIFASSGGELATIFKVGDPAPVGAFTRFSESDISMGTDGKVTLLAEYDGGTKSGIFTAGGGELTTVVKTGDVLPGVGASYGLGGASMAGDEVAFQALVPAGPAPTYLQSTFFLRKGSEPIQRIASAAEVLEASGPYSVSMGRFGFSGYRLAFSSQELANDYGVGIIAVRTIPEPATWLLAALGSSAILLVGTRRRNAANRPQCVRTVALRHCSTAPLLHLLAIGLLFGLAAPPANAQTLEWVRQFGTTEPEDSHDLAADGLGNVYIAGGFGDHLHYYQNFPIYPGYVDAFLTKYDAAGNLQWTQHFSTDQADVAHGVSADGLGNVYIAGGTGGYGGPDAFHDAFIAKYDVAGNLQWTRQLGTGSFYWSANVSADSLGNVFVSGSTEWGPQPNPDDAFLTKYDAAGNFQWIRQLGTSNNIVSISGISVDGLGNVYLSGTSDNVFVRKYDTAGNLEWSRERGAGGGVSADGLGNVFVSSPVLHKFDAAGNLLWSKERGGDVSADGLGNVYLSWRVTSGPNSGYSILDKYDAQGDLEWSNVLDPRDHRFEDLAADGLGNIYRRREIQVRPGALNPRDDPGDSDVLVAKYIDCGGCEPSPFPPIVVDATLAGEIQPGSSVSHQFSISFGDLPVTWSNPVPLRSTVNPPTLSETGLFSWQTTRLDGGGLYYFDVTATNAGGSDTGRLTLRLAIIPEPSALLLLSLGICSSPILVRARRPHLYAKANRSF